MRISDYLSEPANQNHSQVSELKNIWGMCSSPIFNFVGSTAQIRHFNQDIFIMKEEENFKFCTISSFNPFRQVEPAKEKK